MKLYREVNADLNLVSSYDADSVTIRGTRYQDNFVLMPELIVAPWAEGRSFETLLASDMARIAELKPALVLLGTGRKQRFAHPSLFAPLLNAGIGIESMDMGSACRTYNILAAEGRAVAAALLFG